MSKIALITGGSRGLGRDMAIKLAEKENDIVITYLNNEEKANEVVNEIKSTGQKAASLKLDVADYEGYDTFIENFKKTLKERFDSNDFNYLINNAGIGIHTQFEQTTEDQFDTLMNTHLKSVFFLTQKLLSVLSDGGAIINISSALTRTTLPGFGAYAAMKGGVETLTKYQAKELGERGIRVNVLSPGAIETDFGGGALKDNKELNQFVASQTALGRVGLPDDIGSVAAFLCSDEAKWITGQNIEASGGMFI
jgi:NAD(P)-dependent dehydrogenase (short-subunit alcohol dehydrogenase family)